MNARIRELWAQCVIKHTNTPMNWQNAANEFAELIVRECVNEIHVADVGDLKAKGYYLDKVAEHVEKRFGI